MGYMPNVSGADQRVHTINSMEELEQLINAPELKNAVESMPDTASINTPEELEVLKKSAAFQNAKKNLPVVVWQASFDGKKRSNENAIPNGLFMTDFDGIFEDLDALYHSAIEPRIEELGIVVVHKTPSRKGLRVVAQKRYADIVSNQHWMAEMLSLELDKACKDMARASFLVPRDYFYYLAEDLFERDYLSAELIEEPFPIPSAEECTSAESGEKSGETNGETDPATYNGVHITDVLDRYIALKGGEFVVGERNSQELRLCCSLVHYYGVDVIKKYLPTYDLDDKEIDRIIKSAEEYYKKGSTHVAGDFLKILQDLETEEVMKAVPFDEEEFWEKTELPIGIKETLEDISNPNECMVALFSALSLCGFYGTELKYNYLKKGENQKKPIQSRLNFMVLAVGESSCGKSVCKDVYDLWLKQHRLDIEENTDTDRELGTNLTISGLMKKLKATDGKHVINYSSEADQILKNAAIGGYHDVWGVFKSAFDNEHISASYATEAAQSGNIPVKMNTIWSGTPSVLDTLFCRDKNGKVDMTNMENGLFGRFVIIPMKKEYKEIGSWAWDYDVNDVIEDNNSIDENISRAITQMKKYGENYMSYIPLYRELLKAIALWINEMNSKALRLKSIAMENLVFRTAVMGFRCGVIFHILENEGNEELQSISKNAVDFAVNCATYILRVKMQLFGDVFNKVLQSSKIPADMFADEVTLKKSKKLWERVKETFSKTFQNGATKDDIYKLYCQAKGEQVNQKTFERTFRTALNGDKRNAKIIYEVGKREGESIYSFEKPKGVGKIHFIYGKIKNRIKKVA